MTDTANILCRHIAICAVICADTLVEIHTPEIIESIEALMAHDITGDPWDGVLWTHRTTDAKPQPIWPRCGDRLTGYHGR